VTSRQRSWVWIRFNSPGVRQAKQFAAVRRLWGSTAAIGLVACTNLLSRAVFINCNCPFVRQEKQVASVSND
jgi:hypothetical protein